MATKKRGAPPSNTGQNAPDISPIPATIEPPVEEQEEGLPANPTRDVQHQHNLRRVLASIELLRNISDEKKGMLHVDAQRRHWQKRLILVISGVLALLSGGSAAALTVPAADLIGVKLTAAALAFISGFICIITSTYFDDKETVKIFEGAIKYAELRDQIDIFLNATYGLSDALNVAYKKFTDQSSKLQAQYDLLIDHTVLQAKQIAFIEVLNKKYRLVDNGEPQPRYGGGGGGVRRLMKK